MPKRPLRPSRVACIRGIDQRASEIASVAPRSTEPLPFEDDAREGIF
jgi:hypothetical protein